MDDNAELPASADAVFSRVYDDLRGLARRQRGPGDTLETTALVHELYLRMQASGSMPAIEPARFFAYAARAMRHLLIDRARHRLRTKHGGGAAHLDLETVAGDALALDAREALELDDALRALAAEDERAAQVVELHYFGGLELQKIADLLGLTRRTVDRDLAFARTFLKAQM